MPDEKLTADALLAADAPPPPGARVEGDELARLYWFVRGRARELARQEAYWAATNEALADAYGQLEARTAELRAAREDLERLNRDLEARVEEHVREIVVRAKEVEALNVQLQERVQERTRELAIALRRLSRQQPVRAPLEPGHVLGGRVRLERVLGEGGMGTVYLGEDLLTGTRVATKVLRDDHESDPSFLRRFVGEAAAAAAISHPGVIRTLHIDVTPDGRIFQMMEYVEGTDLASRRARGPMPPGAVARIGAEIARALAAAHAVGVVHRDVKPGNVLLCTAAPGVRVLDFGVSKIFGESHRELYATLTAPEAFVG